MKLIRRLLKCISFTAVLFVFQACYGPQEGWEPQRQNLTFRVVDAEGGEPMEGVKVELQMVDRDTNATSSWSLYGFTGEEGVIGVYCVMDYYTGNRFRFTAEDSTYAVQDTVIGWAAFPDTIQIRLARVPDAE